METASFQIQVIALSVAFSSPFITLPHVKCRNFLESNSESQYFHKNNTFLRHHEGQLQRLRKKTKKISKALDLKLVQNNNFNLGTIILKIFGWWVPFGTHCPKILTLHNTQNIELSYFLGIVLVFKMLWFRTVKNT